MATKASVMNEQDRPAPLKRREPGGLANMSDGVVGKWTEFTGFLSDVRSEMKKVVAPSRKEVESTTTVVLIAVFLFGLFFFVVDAVFSRMVEQILHRMGAQ